MRWLISQMDFNDWFLLVPSILGLLPVVLLRREEEMKVKVKK